MLCYPMNYSPPGSSVHGIFQARTLEWVAIPFSRGSSWPRDGTQVSWIAGEFFTIWATREALSTPRTLNNRNAGITDEAKKSAVSEAKVTQSYPTPCDPIDYTVHGILQARILEWVAIPFARASSQPRNWTQVSCIADGFFTSWATREALRRLQR